MPTDDELDEDPRYRLSAKGAALFGAVYLVMAAVSFLLAFTLGTKPAGEVSFIFGFPAWVFWTLIVWQVCIVVIIFCLVRFVPYFREIPLTASGEREEDEPQ